MDKSESHCTVLRRRAIREWPEAERPREKLIKAGAEALSDGELLAIILRIGNAGQSAEDLGRELLARCGGLPGLDRVHVEELLSLPGLGIAKAAQIKAAIEIGKRVRIQEIRPRTFDSSAEVADYLSPRFEGKRYECFFALMLDGQNQLLVERIIAEGIPTQATVYVRRIMEEALRVSASSFVVVHNHPSGNPQPSSSDDATTQNLKSASEVLNLIFLDHIILGAGSYYSYAEHKRI
ncbi:RadC-like JAB domain protein [uncultured archaeon]|nr:RadC-like JAB domain protein [uncultured archaeon]